MERPLQLARLVVPILSEKSDFELFRRKNLVMTVKMSMTMIPKLERVLLKLKKMITVSGFLYLNFVYNYHCRTSNANTTFSVV